LISLRVDDDSTNEGYRPAYGASGLPLQSQDQLIESSAFH
jgi:hypothetical protein